MDVQPLDNANAESKLKNIAHTNSKMEDADLISSSPAFGERCLHSLNEDVPVIASNATGSSSLRARRLHFPGASWPGLKNDANWPKRPILDQVLQFLVMQLPSLRVTIIIRRLHEPWLTE
ncbi:hypothetical protein [Oryzifoliimicrobium ureilyticus]|uniref:hypothetical protein n=1 Tax=Oryzifoliimicrobium ureilyticus TaxID=3113724 RepID=UPI0030768681